jgi:hypothetical protein
LGIFNSEKSGGSDYQKPWNGNSRSLLNVLNGQPDMTQALPGSSGIFRHKVTSWTFAGLTGISLIGLVVLENSLRISEPEKL